MKICRFQTGDKISAGVLTDDHVVVFENRRMTNESYPLSDVKLLAPVAPSKIVWVGRNYAEHAAELGNDLPTEPLLFLKAPSAVINNGEAIKLPTQSKRVEHEGELGVVIGRRCHALFDDEDAMHYVLGYTCLNDVTARDLQRKDVQFTRGKSFDTFCPIGPVIETNLELDQITLTTRVNGEVRQFARMWQMVFPIDYLIRYIANVMTLMPGDVIATGTPSGVGKLDSGDVCEVEITGVGTLRNPVE